MAGSTPVDPGSGDRDGRADRGGDAAPPGMVEALASAGIIMIYISLALQTHSPSVPRSS